MSKLHRKPEPVVESPVVESSAPVVGPVLTPDLVARLRAMESLEASVRVLSPDSARRVPVDATYRLNESCETPLPQRRGASIKVVATAVRLERPFKIADIATALPDVKSASFWARRLVKSGHFIEVG
jgi:hypothetical protein